MSSTDRVIRISKGRAPGPVVHRVTENVDTSKQPQAFTDMQRNMEDELEKRRMDWEKEVEKMQQDFFNIHTTDSGKKAIMPAGYSSSPGGNREVAVASRNTSLNPIKPVGPAGQDIFDISNRKNLYTELPDGTKVFKMRFDVRGFNADEISVRAEGTKLTVTAIQEEGDEGGNKNTRQYNRQADIPEDVDPDTVTSSLSSDGILTLEAPVIEGVSSSSSSARAIQYEEHLPIDFDGPHQFLDGPHEYHRVLEYGGHGPSVHTHHPSVHTHYHHGYVPGHKKGQCLHVGRSADVHTYRDPIKHDFPETDYSHRSYTSGGHKIITPSKYRNSVNNNNNNAKSLISSSSSSHASPYKSVDPNVISTKYGPLLKIEVHIGDFQPEDVKIVLSDRKVSISAKREESIRGRSSRREFSREFDIPEPMLRRYFKAKLTKDGRLVFGGSFASNTDHDMVLQELYNSMPIYGNNIEVE